MVGRNERKLQILDYLSDVEESTARDIAEACDIEIHNARTLLARYHRYGLLTRYTADRHGTRVYGITTRGLDRIDWLRGEEEHRDAEDEDLVDWRFVRDDDEEELDDWDLTRDLLEDELLDDRDADGDDTVDGEVSWRHLTLAELRERVRLEEARVRLLEAEVHGRKTGDWSDFI